MEWLHKTKANKLGISHLARGRIPEPKLLLPPTGQKSGKEKKGGKATPETKVSRNFYECGEP